MKAMVNFHTLPWNPSKYVIFVNEFMLQASKVPLPLPD
jgi:hypothetical protein